MIDEEYKQRFTDQLMRSIIELSIIEQPGQPRTALIRAYELIDSMLSMIALLSASSVETQTPARTRRLCDELARKIQRRINSAQQQPNPFDQVIPGALNS